jgi:general stress protein 26
MATHSPSPAHQTLWDLIKEMRFGMMTHRHLDGSLHAHPLTTQNRSLDEGVLYFFVSRTTELGQRIALDGDVNITYCDTHKDHYVSVTGYARVSHDLALRQRLFNAMSRAWFPAGPTDPNLELVAVQILHAEYWNISESKVTQLFKLATAAVTGQPPRIGEHQAVHFS